MKTMGGTSRASGLNSLHHLLTTEFDDVDQARPLFEEFLRQKSFNDSFCLNLLAMARRKRGASWALRRAAILMLEHQVLKLDSTRLDDFDWLLTQLNLKPARGPGHEITSSVLKEGFSTTDLRCFVNELRRKLERLNRVHDRIRGTKTSED